MDRGPVDGEAGIGAALKGLRGSRGLSLGEVSRRSGIPKATLSHWESGARLPRGVALERLLDAVAADARQRARLLHAADPGHARVALLHSPLGPAVAVGQVFRAMRARRGMTQADLARGAGVTQATVARWESGDAAPDASAMHAALFALGASAEEAVAAASAANTAPIRLSNDLREAHVQVGAATSVAPRELRDIVAMGFEAEAWRRASRDARWDPLLCEIVGQSANRQLSMGQEGEARLNARRTLRLATSPDARIFGVAAVGTLASLARRGGTDPGTILRGVESWMARLPVRRVCNYWSWLHMERGFRLAEMGRLEEAETAAGRAAETVGAACETDRYHLHIDWLIEVRLRAGRSDRALKLVDECSPNYLNSLLGGAAAFHANGMPVPDAWMERLRTTIRNPEHDQMRRDTFAGVERRQARLVGASTESG